MLSTHMKVPGEHLQGLKEFRERGTRDVIFLHETHLKDIEHNSAQSQYAALWGYKYTMADTTSLRFSGKHRSAGVAILINPYDALRNAHPWKQKQWSENLIMVSEGDKRRGFPIH